MTGNQDADAVYSAGRQHWWARYCKRLLDLRGKTPGMHGISTRENRETLPVLDTKL